MPDGELAQREFCVERFSGCFLRRLCLSGMMADRPNSIRESSDAGYSTISFATDATCRNGKSEKTESRPVRITITFSGADRSSARSTGPLGKSRELHTEFIKRESEPEFQPVLGRYPAKLVGRKAGPSNSMAAKKIGGEFADRTYGTFKGLGERSARRAERSGN